ncbi:MAG: anaerobic ribonucleoside-triphosphate reductase [Anaerovoracaceae bacterium]
MNIEITGNVPAQEAQAYVEYLQDKYNRKLEALDISIDGDYVDLDYRFAPVKIERIRRITGYLVGTMDNWNDAKTAEERDRVKHETVAGSGEMETL